MILVFVANLQNNVGKYIILPNTVGISSKMTKVLLNVSGVALGCHIASFGSQIICKKAIATHLHGYNTSDMSFYQIHMFSQQMGHLPMEMLLYAHYLVPMKGMSQPKFQLF